MRVFVTGASGWIGSRTVPELLRAGHQVVGLARSDESAATLVAAGVEVRRGDLSDLDGLRAAAADADGVIHLAFIHDFSQYEMAAESDRRAIEVMGDALAGTGRPLLIVSGVLGLSSGGAVPNEEVRPAAGGHPRIANAALTLALADRDVRSGVVRLPPTVHGAEDHGFIAALVGIARERGVSGYIADGATRWSAVHRDDAARAFALALDKAPAGAVLHAVAEEGVATRTIAEVVGRHLHLPVVSIDPEEAAQHFGWLALMLSMDGAASSEYTRRLLGWAPTGPTLVEDLDAGHYFDLATAGT